MHKPRQKVIHNPIPTSFFQDLNPFYVGIWISVYIVRFCIMCFLCNSFEHNQRCRDLLVPFLFHEVTSLHPPSFHRNKFFHLYTIGWLISEVIADNCRLSQSPPITTNGPPSSTETNLNSPLHFCVSIHQPHLTISTATYTDTENVCHVLAIYLSSNKHLRAQNTFVSGCFHGMSSLIFDFVHQDRIRMQYVLVVYSTHHFQSSDKTL